MLSFRDRCSLTIWDLCYKDWDCLTDQQFQTANRCVEMLKQHLSDNNETFSEEETDLYVEVLTYFN